MRLGVRAGGELGQDAPAVAGRDRPLTVVRAVAPDPALGRVSGILPDRRAFRRSVADIGRADTRCRRAEWLRAVGLVGSVRSFFLGSMFRPQIPPGRRHCRGSLPGSASRLLHFAGGLGSHAAWRGRSRYHVDGTAAFLIFLQHQVVRGTNRTALTVGGVVFSRSCSCN